MKDWFVMSTARDWVAAVVLQGNRVLELQGRDCPPEQTADEFFAWSKDRQSKPNFTHVEDHLFITTVHKSVEWLVEAHNRNLLEPDLTSDFLSAADNSRVVRNIREHYIEYLNGGGKQRGQNVAIIALNGEEGAAHIDASSVIVTDEGRLIGGRINVQLLMAAADALYPALHQQQQLIMIHESQARQNN